MIPPLKNKTAVVTGSTSGIGLGIATALAHAGANVVLNGCGERDTIEQFRRGLAAETGVVVNYHGADLTDAAQVIQLVKDTEKAFGTLDILINNAGVQHVSPIEEFSAEHWTEIQRVILESTFHAIKAALPGMKRRNHGRIVNICSAHGLVASPFKSAYVAAKHGQLGLTKSVALEVATFDITCNAVCPGYVRTGLVERQIDAQARAHGIPREQVLRDIILAVQPTKRLIEVEEVAELVLFLCRSSVRSITGAAIAIDGGWTAR